MVDEVAVAEFDDVGFGEIDLAAAVEIAGFLEVNGKGAGDAQGGFPTTLGPFQTAPGDFPAAAGVSGVHGVIFWM